MVEPTAPHRERPTLALVLDHLGDDARLAMHAGVRTAARRRGCNLLTILSQCAIGEQGSGTREFPLLELAQDSSIDGYIVALRFLCVGRSPERAQEVLRRFDPKRTILLDAHVEGYESVGADRSAALVEAVHLLIERRGRRRLALICGDPLHEWQDRWVDTFRKTVSGLDVEMRDSWIFRADGDGSGNAAVEALLSGETPDGVICCSDTIAMRLMDRARQMGMMVPEDLAVIGTDEGGGGRFFEPPVTTVDRWLPERGQVAVRNLMRLIGCEPVDVAEEEPEPPFPLLAVRQSCGGDAEVLQEGSSAWERPQEDLPAYLEQCESDLIELLSGKTKLQNLRPIPREGLRVWIRALRSALESGEHGELSAQTYRMLLSMRELGVDETIVEVLVQTVLWRVGPVARDARQAGDFCRLMAWTMRQVHDFAWRARKYRGRQYAFRNETTRPIGYHLIRALDLDRLNDELSRFAAGMGISRYCICDRVRAGSSAEQVRVLVAGRDGESVVPRSPMLSHRLDPPEFLFGGSDDSPWSVVAIPLELASMQGFALIEPADGHAAALHEFAESAGAVIDEARLLKQVNEQNKKLARLNQELEQEVAQRRIAQQKLAEMATHDHLTGLPNRLLLSDRLQQAMHRHLRNEEYTYSVVFIDLDHFKEINDTRGHAAGDQLLVGVAQRLREAVRPMDTVARLAGDEFIVLLENIVIPGDAISVAERIRSRLGQGVKIGNETLSLTCSIGITFGIREYGTDVAKPIHDADIAMYRSKEGGRNRVSLANGHTR